MDQFKKSMSEMEKKTYDVAKQHLKTSFSMEKSIGYLNFISS
tara:strand:+ start:1062 stop:1187 length:126 start_codon:yes stop_codon:yes gene_type:complete